jgi:catechol 2,3-dioxygenase-like lactoylglutathione lyase family enzyme
MNWTLELVLVPVSDVDHSKVFYADRLGFNVDHDTKISDDFHFAQLTPPGSGCSIAIERGMSTMEPGSLEGLQLVVPDIRAARAELADRGVDVTEVRVVGPGGQRAAEEGDELDNVGFCFFSDPDGNGWAVQQISARG